mgnify:CR=1 FL=1
MFKAAGIEDIIAPLISTGLFKDITIHRKYDFRVLDLIDIKYHLEIDAYGNYSWLSYLSGNRIFPLEDVFVSAPDKIKERMMRSHGMDNKKASAKKIKGHNYETFFERFNLMVQKGNNKINTIPILRDAMRIGGTESFNTNLVKGNALP